MPTARTAVADGLRRTLRAPAVVAGLFGVTLFVSLPLSLALESMIASHLGRSLMGDAVLRSPNFEWWQEFLGQAGGIGTTFVPSILGFGAILQNLSNLLDNMAMATTIAGVTAAWLTVWAFLSGGIVDRLARDRRVRARGFFAASGAHFGAVLRLGLFALLVYWLLFGWIHPWLLDSQFARLTRDLTVERTAFAVRVVLYVLFGSLLAAVNCLVDYARVRLIVEDRRSALGALLAAARFIARHPGRVIAVYGLNGALFVLLIAMYAVVAPPATSAGWLILLVGEIYILARHFLKVAFYASAISLFQRSLAHAAYVAAPPLVWPESPAAEAIVNAGSAP